MIRTPYLIQRAEIDRPLAPATVRLSQAVDFDYMGSAEFEFGALPQSFRRIEAVADSWKCRLVPEIMEGEIALRVWSAFTDEEFEEYKGYLLRLRNPGSNPIRTKEGVRFQEGETRTRYSNTDFWWDIDNDAMFGFDKTFMKRVGDYVANSLIYMNEQKAKK